MRLKNIQGILDLKNRIETGCSWSLPSHFNKDPFFEVSNILNALVNMQMVLEMKTFSTGITLK